MAITITKPTVGGSEDSWGTTINTALDNIALEINSNADGTNAITLQEGGFAVGATTVTVTGAELNILDGATVTTNDLNLLAGISDPTPTTGQILQIGSGGTFEAVDAASGVTAGLGLEYDTTNTEQLNVASDLRVVDFVGYSASVAGNSGTENNYVRFDLADTIRFHTQGAEKANINASGDFSATGDVTAYSDARLKTDISEIVGALDIVHSMRGVNFTKIDTGRRGTGVIAQEVQDLVPEAVHEDENGYLTVAYGNLVGVLIEAIKELSDEVKILKQDK